MQGDRTPKKFGQAALSTTATAIVTGESGKRKELLKIYIANTNATTARKVTLYAYGTGAGNTLVHEISLEAKASTFIDDSGIVLLDTETFSAKQDSGTDVTVTVLGVEEEL